MAVSSSKAPAGPEQGQSKDAVPDPSARTVSRSCVPRKEAGTRRSWLPTEGCAAPQIGPYGVWFCAQCSAAFGTGKFFRKQGCLYSSCYSTPAWSESLSTSFVHLITDDIN